MRLRSRLICTPTRSSSSAVATIFFAEHDPSWLVRRFGGHVDLPRLRAGNMAGLFLASGHSQSPRSAVSPRHIARSTRSKASAAGAFRICRSAEEIVACRQAGEVAALIGIEGGHSLERGENSRVVVERLQSLGQRGSVTWVFALQSQCARCSGDGPGSRRAKA